MNWLTLIIVNDTVKEDALLANLFKGLKLFNQNLSGVEIVICNQQRTTTVAEEASRGFNVRIHQCCHPFAGNHAVWDLMAELSAITNDSTGEYQMVVHKECVFGMDYFAALQEYLQQHEAALAVANMQRVGDICLIKKNSSATPSLHESSVRGDSAVIYNMIDEGRRDDLQKFLAHIPDVAWNIWYPDLVREARKHGKWCEDVFVARTDWLKCVRFYEHAGRMQFQDIYDCLREIEPALEKAGMMPKVLWPPTNHIRLYHLYHGRDYSQFNPETAAYFEGTKPLWEGTYWGTPEYLELCRKYQDGTIQLPEIIATRFVPTGTVTRYGLAFREWLSKQPGQ